MTKEALLAIIEEFGAESLLFFCFDNDKAQYYFTEAFNPNDIVTYGDVECVKLYCIAPSKQGRYDIKTVCIKPLTTIQSVTCLLDEKDKQMINQQIISVQF